jgi:hypothetical protein
MANALLPPGHTRPLPAFYALKRPKNSGNVHRSQTDVSISITSTTANLPPYNVGATHIIGFTRDTDGNPKYTRTRLYPPSLE